MGERQKTRMIPLVVFISGLAILAANAAWYWPFVSDDALISLRYSKRLVEGHGLTWTEGRPVEGYSNLLWVLFCAGLGAAGIEWVATLRVLGVTCSAAAIGAIAYAYRRYRWADALPMMAAVFLIAAAGPVGIWAIGGLEQPLVLALLAWAMVLLFPTVDGDTRVSPRFLFACLLFGLLCLTRPDGALFTAAAVAGLLLVRISARKLSAPAVRQGIVLTVIPASFYLSQLAFRLWYYGDWVPNTAYAKLAPSLRHWVEGLWYIAGGIIALAPFTLLAAWYVSHVLQRNDDTALVRRPRVLFIATVLLFWIAYVIFIGGDIFPGRRHWMPLIAPLAMLTAEAVSYLQVRGLPEWPRRRTVRFAIAMLALFVALQVSALQNRRALIERWEWDGEVVGLMLKRGFGEEQPLLAVTAAGCLPFWSELPALDMLGLNDYYLARNRPENFGAGYLGHELGDGAYILEQRPDVVIFNGPEGGPETTYRSGLEMLDMPAFHAMYSMMTFEGQDPYTFRSDIYVLRESERIGLQREENTIEIPAYLLAGNPDSVVYLQGDEFVVDAGPGKPVAINDLAVPKGTWVVEAVPPAQGRVHIDSGDENGSSGPLSPPYTFSPTDDAATVTIHFEPTMPMSLRGLRLRRPL